MTTLSTALIILGAARCVNHNMHTTKLALPVMLALACASAAADVIPAFGVAQQFAVLGAQAVTNTNATTLHGDLGVSPGTSITGAGSVTFASGGEVHQADSVALQAQADARTAYTALAALTGGVDLSGRDLGTLGVLTPGVYFFSSSAALSGNLTLDFANDPSGVFVFQIGSTLTTASDSMVNVINGTSSNGIYFQIGSSATLGSGSDLAGNILAQQSITFNPAANIACGRALALTGSVTLIGNTISNDCSAYGGPGDASDYGSAGYSGVGVAALPPVDVPEPGSLALFGLGLLMASHAVMKRRPVIKAARAQS